MPDRTLTERAADLARNAHPHDRPEVMPMLALLVEAVERLTAAVERAAPERVRVKVVNTAVDPYRAAMDALGWPQAERAVVEHVTRNRGAFGDPGDEHAAPSGFTPILYEITVDAVNHEIVRYADSAEPAFILDEGGGGREFLPLASLEHVVSEVRDRPVLVLRAPALPKLTGTLRVLRRPAYAAHAEVIWSGPIIESGEGWLKAASDLAERLGVGVPAPTVKPHA